MEKFLYSVFVDENGSKFYKNKDGFLHREDGPAIERLDGHKEWFQNDHLHRLDGPAIEWYEGSKEYYVEGQLHREDGPAIIRASDGTEEYWFEGKQYCEKDYWKLTCLFTSLMNDNHVFLAGKKYKLVLAE